MKNVKTILTIALALLALAATAQKGRRKPAAKAAKTAHAMAETAGQRLYKSMLGATAKVMFVDSVVVGKAGFLSHIPLGSSAGRLGYGQPAASGMGLGQFENDLGDRRLFARGDSTYTFLYSQSLLGDGWGEPEKLAEIDGGEYALPNFPFLCADGATLFFAAQGEHSMGGYDIFMTTYNADEGQWYEPQNYGLPFNSTANDYLLAIDDRDSLGWLVTDRRQHPDSVCVYTFVPSATRQDFTADDPDDALLERYASIRSMADTWAFGNRAAALQRLQGVRAHRQEARGEAAGEALVINDARVAHAAADLRTAEARRLYAQWQELGTMLRETRAALASGRAQGAANRQEALQQEARLLQQQRDIKDIEKRIRNAENRR